VFLKALDGRANPFGRPVTASFAEGKSNTLVGLQVQPRG
jgi:hypothetical protein